MERSVAQMYMASDPGKTHLIVVPGMLGQRSNLFLNVFGNVCCVVGPGMVAANTVARFDKSNPRVGISLQQEPGNQSILKATAHQKMIKGMSREITHRSCLVGSGGTHPIPEIAVDDHMGDHPLQSYPR